MNLNGFVSMSNSLTAPSRVNGSLAVSRAIGDFHCQPFVSDIPYSRSIQLEPEDKFVILACDGLWDEVSDQEAVDLVASHINTEEPVAIASRLRDLAYLRGGDDNISVLIFFL